MEEHPTSGNGALPQPPAAETAPSGPAPEKPRRSTRKRVILGLAIALIALIVIAGLVGGLYAWRFLSAANSLTIDDIDMSRVSDGIYEGSYEVFHVKAAVQVTVEDGRIVSIAFTDSGRISEETQQEIDEIFDEVISSQSLDVDMTSGASVSKKVSLKAVEEALGGGD